MSADLNHVVVHSTDAAASADFLGRVLGAPVRPKWGPFFPVELANGVTVEFMDDDPPFTEQHCAFLVDDETFDAARARLAAWHVTIWADPSRRQVDAVNHRYGGRGLYFDDPDGHLMEMLTAPYRDTPEGTRER